MFLFFLVGFFSMRVKFVEFSIISDLLKDPEPLDYIIMVSMFALSTEDRNLFETKTKTKQKRQLTFQNVIKLIQLIVT